MYETQAGRAAHLNWLRTPVEPATVSSDLGLHLMRFVMMERVLPPEEALTFLQSLADTLAALTARLKQHAAAADVPGRHPRLALDHGIAIHRASLRRAEQTVAALSADLRCPPAVDVRNSPVMCDAGVGRLPGATFSAAISPATAV